MKYSSLYPNLMPRLRIFKSNPDLMKNAKGAYKMKEVDPNLKGS
jgi:hypothetical protein